mgnify:FL=1
MLMEALAAPTKDRMKSDGIAQSTWLQSLATFTGIVCKRYSAMEVPAILQYILNQLKAGNHTDLIVLQQVRVNNRMWISIKTHAIYYMSMDLYGYCV